MPLDISAAQDQPPTFLFFIALPILQPCGKIRAPAAPSSDLMGIIEINPHRLCDLVHYFHLPRPSAPRRDKSSRSPAGHWVPKWRARSAKSSGRGEHHRLSSGKKESAVAGALMGPTPMMSVLSPSKSRTVINPQIPEPIPHTHVHGIQFAAAARRIAPARSWRRATATRSRIKGRHKVQVLDTRHAECAIVLCFVEVASEFRPAIEPNPEIAELLIHGELPAST